jgi:hypothetical protein
LKDELSAIAKIKLAENLFAALKPLDGELSAILKSSWQKTSCFATVLNPPEVAS